MDPAEVADKRAVVTLDHAPVFGTLWEWEGGGREMCYKVNGGLRRAAAGLMGR